MTIYSGNLDHFPDLPPTLGVQMATKDAVVFFTLRWYRPTFAADDGGG